jgi:hypothetical protein
VVVVAAVVVVFLEVVLPEEPEHALTVLIWLERIVTYLSFFFYKKKKNLLGFQSEVAEGAPVVQKLAYILQLDIHIMQLIINIEIYLQTKYIYYIDTQPRMNN